MPPATAIESPLPLLGPEGLPLPEQPSMKGFFAAIHAWDMAIVKFLHALDIPKLIYWPLVAFVRIGDGYLWIGVAAWLFYAEPWSVFRGILVECLLAVGLSLLAYWPLKLIIRRTRPYSSIEGISRKVPPLDKYSFPSGHTMNNLAVALTLASQMPVFYLPAIGIPLTLGVLRVAFGVHFLTDIIAGAFLGTASHLLAKFLLPYLTFLTG